MPQDAKRLPFTIVIKTRARFPLQAQMEVLKRPPIILIARSDSGKPMIQPGVTLKTGMIPKIIYPIHGMPGVVGRDISTVLTACKIMLLIRLEIQLVIQRMTASVTRLILLVVMAQQFRQLIMFQVIS